MTGHLIDGRRYHFDFQASIADAHSYGWKVTRDGYVEDTVDIGWVAWAMGDRNLDGSRANTETRWLAWDAEGQPVKGDRPWGRFRTRADAVRAIVREAR